MRFHLKRNNKQLLKIKFDMQKPASKAGFLYIFVILDYDINYGKHL